LTHRAELQAAHRNPAFRVPTPTLNLGQVRGGDNPNRICGECELSFDLRLLPGMDLDTERERVRECVRTALADSDLALHFDSLFDGTPPAETPADAPIVQAAETITGETAQAVAFGTEAGFFQRLGMDVLVMGPGSIAQAHQPDEFVALEQLGQTVALLGELIGRFCRAPASDCASRD